jgi:hypothetical protein
MGSNWTLVTKTARVLHDPIYVLISPLKVVTDCLIYDVLTEGAPKPNGVTDGLLPIVDPNRPPFHFHGYDTKLVTDPSK